MSTRCGKGASGSLSLATKPTCLITQHCDAAAYAELACSCKKILEQCWVATRGLDVAAPSQGISGAPKAVANKVLMGVESELYRDSKALSKGVRV